MGNIYQWSLNAAENANSDDSINWAEGQPPSSVNNSARAMMARIREYIEDKTIIPLTGVENAYSGVIKSNITKYRNGMSIVAQASSTNSGEATLSLNSIKALPIFKTAYNGIVPLSATDIKKDLLYNFLYIPTLNNNTGGWLLVNPSPKKILPSGMISSFATRLVPEGWLFCDGREISRSLYPELFAAIGTTWGAGNNVDTFNIPDFRGYFLRSWSNGGDFDSSRAFASKQDSQNLAHNHTGNTDASGAHAHDVSVPNQDRWGVDSNYRWNPGYAFGIATTTWAGNHTHSFTTANSGGGEARPLNIAVTYGIKI